MNFNVTLPDFAKLTDGIEGDIAGASTRAMRRAATELRDDFRGQVKAAGMSQRLANTWRGETFPKKLQSMNPAGYIWSNAPAIIESYARGATIRPVRGARFLWIPTDNVPRRGRGGAKPMTPSDIENEFNQDLIIRNGRGRTKLAYVNVVRARNRRGFRRSTKGRTAQGRVAEPVLMFVLVPSVTKPRLFDLDATAQRGADRFVAYLTEELRNV